MELVDTRAQLLEKHVRFGKVLARRALAFVQIGNRVKAERVDAEVQPEFENFEQRFVNCRIVEIQIRLMRIEAMPVIRFGDGVPGPIGRFEILEDDARVLVLLRRIAPDVVLTPWRSRLRATRLLKPRMCIARVIDHQLGDDANSAQVRLAQQGFEICKRSVIRMDGRVIRDVITVVAQRRRVKRQQPQHVDTEVLQVVELAG